MGHYPQPPHGPERRDHIGFQVHRLHVLCRRMVDTAAFGEDPAGKPTRMQSWIISYLYHRQEQEVFQRDIQELLSVRRSTVTGILQLMEKNGLIVRTSVDEDARLKKITLTPKAVEMHEQVQRGISSVENKISAGLTAEEKAIFMRLCEKIRANLE